jgi:hypothetical protein
MLILIGISVHQQQEVCDREVWGWGVTYQLEHGGLVAQYGNTDTDTDTNTDTDTEGLIRAAKKSPEALELAGMSLGPLHCALNTPRHLNLGNGQELGEA